MTGAVDLLAGYGGRKRVAEAFAAQNLSPNVAHALLAARSSLFGAGNRRRLFSQFDDLFREGGTAAIEDLEAGIQNPKAADSATPTSYAVQLQSIKLRNWKVFERARFDFPRLMAGRPVVLIGGKNGYGKTSLLEAILFGLYGQRALLDVDRALWADGAQSGSARAAHYRQIIDRAFHEPARARGEEVAAVHLSFETSNGPLEVERRWYIRTGGHSSDDDEVLTLWAGESRDLVPVPEGQDAHLHYQEEIARRFMPASVAPFFLFDGEQVKRLAERQLADQVRLGVESVLGLHAWRDTVADLRDYAKDRGRGGILAEDHARLYAAADAIDAEEAVTSEAIAALEAQLVPLRVRRDNLLEKLGELGGGTFASMQELHERRHRLGQDLARHRAELARAASQSLPLALVGECLLARLAKTLEADQAHRAPVDGLKTETLEALLSAIDDVEPDLQALDRETLQARIRRGWSRLTEQMSEGNTRHHYLDGRLRQRVMERVGLRNTGVSHVQNQFASMIRQQAAYDEVEATIRLRDVHDRSQLELREDLKAITDQIDGLERQRRTLDRTLGRLKNQGMQIADKLKARRNSRKISEPSQRRAEAALQAARKLEQVIKQIAPICFESFAEAVSRAYRALAHKTVVDHVTIDPQGAVSLINRHRRIVHNFDLSAGESQVFAMALIAAVADTARCPMPLVIDTPLGRLDPDHRERVLEFFTTQPRQTILLSQPDEIHGRYLAQIKDRIAAHYRLDHEGGADGLGSSVACEGYFPGMAA